MSQSNSQVGVPPQSNFSGSLPFRPNQHTLSYPGRPEDYSHTNRRPAHPIQQQQHHHGPVPSNSPGVPSPSASPGARRTPPHDMSKQGIRHSGQQPMSVGHQPAVLLPQYRMQHQAGQMHQMQPGIYPIAPATGQRPAPMQPTNAPPIAPGGGGPRTMQHGGASAHYGMQNAGFVQQQHPMMSSMFTPRASSQFPPPATPYAFYNFQPTQSVQQNQGYFAHPGQIPQTGYNAQVMPPQQPQGMVERKPKKILRIQDSTSGEDVTGSIMRDSAVGVPVSSQAASTGSTSTPPQSNWKPRRNEAKPAMIDQIRKEAEQGKQSGEQEQLTARLATRQGKRSQGSMEKHQEDGWNTVPGNRSTKQNVIKNPYKLTITTHKEPETQEQQENRRIQAEFLTKVSQVASNVVGVGNKKKKMKKRQDLEKKPVKDDMYEAFRPTEAEETETAPPEVQDEEVKIEKLQEPDESGAAAEEGNVVVEEVKVAAYVREVEAAKPEVEEAPVVVKEPQAAAPAPMAAALLDEEAKTNNVAEPPPPPASKSAVGVAASVDNGVTEVTVLKEEAKHKVEDENATNKERELKPEYNKIGLKYSYSKDQWSPVNQAGKKQDDRVFLLQFQPDCTSKPQGLPDIPDIVLEKAEVRPHLDSKSMTSKGPDNLFMPTYMKSPRMNQQAPSFPSGNKRQSRVRKVISKPSVSQEETTARLAPRQGKRPKGSMEKHQEDDRNTVPGNRSTKQNVIENPPKLKITRNNWKPRENEGKPVMINQIKKKEAEPLNVTVTALSKEEYRKRSWDIIGEFVNLKDFKKAITSLQKLKGSNHQHVFVRFAVEDVLQRSLSHRVSVGRLFHRLLESSVISVEQFNIGVREMLEFSEEIKIYVPMYWVYIGDIFGAMSALGGTNLAFLRDVVRTIPTEKLGKPAEECMAEITKSSDELTIRCFAECGSVSRSQCTRKEATMIVSFKKGLISLFHDRNLENSKAFDFIEKTLSPEVRETKEFIGALVKAVCYGSVIGESVCSKVDNKILKKRLVLIHRYIDDDAKHELQALYAVQYLNYNLENPPGFLHLLFNVLRDEGIVPNDKFVSWRDSKDPEEQLGKSIALNSLTNFWKTNTYRS